MALENIAGKKCKKADRLYINNLKSLLSKDFLQAANLSPANLPQAKYQEKREAPLRGMLPFFYIFFLIFSEFAFNDLGVS